MWIKFRKKKVVNDELTTINTDCYYSKYYG